MDGFTSDCDGGEPSDGSIRSSHSTQQQQQESHQGTPPVISVTHKSPSTLVFVADGKRMAAAMSMPVSRAVTQCSAADDDDQEALPPPAWCSTVTVDFTPTSAGCSTLAPLCHDIITMIVADFCDDATARRLMATCRTLRYVCIAMDPVIWRSKCIAAWAGKVRFDPMYWLKDEAPQSLRPLATFPMSPASVRLRRMLDVDSDAAVEPNTPEDVVAFSRLPTEIVTPLLRAAKLMQRGSSAPPEHLARQIATSWRAAYHVSLKDSKRDFLTDEEVLELRWSVEFLRRPEPMPSTEAVFVREGLVKRVQPAPFLPFVPWQLHDSGRKVQVDVYPAHRVRRLDDTWGWNIENAFVRFYSVLRPP